MIGNEKCRDCRYFSYCDVPVNVTRNDYPTQKRNGFCSKVFPRGYTNAGKHGGYKWSGQAYCFEFEQNGDEQMSLLCPPEVSE